MRISKPVRIGAIFIGLIYLLLAFSIYAMSNDYQYINETAMFLYRIISILYLTISIFLFAGKRNKTLAILLSIKVLVYLLLILSGGPYFEGEDYLDTVYFIKELSVAVVSILFTFSRSKSKKIWFIPIISSIAFFAITLATEYIYTIDDSLFILLLLTIPDIFLSFYFKPNKNVSEQNHYIQPQFEDYENYQNPIIEDSHSISKSINFDVDKLLEYKQLLDDGVITQEDFDKIKNSIMNS